MKELIHTTDPVVISAIQAYLKSMNIPVIVLDTHMSILEGSISMLIPQRVMVDENDYDAAMRVLVPLELVPDPKATQE